MISIPFRLKVTRTLTFTFLTFLIFQYKKSVPLNILFRKNKSFPIVQKYKNKLFF